MGAGSLHSVLLHVTLLTCLIVFAGCAVLVSFFAKSHTP